ncbi:MAG: hypothetical protein DMD81_15330 [Candidatus Rokuibacteriota bacterium]|nr:MAG: hypothetical protein DMD81_15330 [Candidatus Rokubacteria bacterium]
MNAPGPAWSDRVAVVGYSDLDGRPGFKLAMQEVGGRFYLYLGHLWHRGWSIVDVTDPSAPKLLRFIEGLANTWTIQVQVADGTMITALERIAPNWGGDSQAPFENGVLIWDVRDPENPVRLGHWATGGSGTHRNYYDGGRYVHLAAGLDGYVGNVYQSIDIADPAHPVEVARWWFPGQGRAGGETGAPAGTSLHGGPYVAGERAFLPYGAAGLIVLDLADRTKPRMIGRLSFSPPFQANIAVHTAVPLPRRKLVAVNSEAIAEDCREPLGFAGLVDITNETTPTLVSLFPLPAPPPGAPFRNFCERGGRFGPHNQHQAQHQPVLLDRDDVIFLTYFNAGLRIVDVSDARLPREVGWFVPPDPTVRRGVLPSKLVAQSKDVLVDRRGYIYLTDKNHGLYVLRWDGLA